MSQEVSTTELTEESELITPGRLLSEGRVKQGLSQEQVAEKLNFRSTLVKEIEDDVFDRNLPSTFNRGYLRNFAKLVGVDTDQVLTAYEQLGDAEKQSAKLQSFSKGTEKQAQHNRIMWISYLILAVLIGMTLLWYFQNDRKVEPIVPVTNTSQVDSNDSTLNQETSNQPIAATTEAPNSVESSASVVSSAPLDTSADESALESDDQLVALSETLKKQPESTELSEDVVSEPLESNATQVAENQEPESSLVVFNFSGDCWVNIYDATGERVAWGVKKTGYEMKIEGIAPFRVTLGKPELVSINFQGAPVDLSAFNKGNIAKFTLPLSES